MSYTHIGHKAHVGHVHSGAALASHRMPRGGKLHALNGGPKRFTSLCGEVVHADDADEFGFRRENGPRNISPAETSKCKVTCKRCLARLS